MTRTAEGPRLRRHAHFRVFSSHRDAMRTGSAVIVQRGGFVIAGDCGPLEDLIRCGFPNELLAGEPKNLTYVGFGFSAYRNCLFRREENFFAVRSHNYPLLYEPT